MKSEREPLPRCIGHFVRPAPANPDAAVRMLWKNQDEWPFCPGYTFLPAAFDLMGRHRFANWTGNEGWEPAPVQPISEERILQLSGGRPEIERDLRATAERMRREYPVKLATFQRGKAVRKEFAGLCARGQLITAIRSIPGGDTTPVEPKYWVAENIVSRFETCQMSAL